MCGISGVAPADPARPVDRELLRRMTSILRHRGPDSDGFFIAPGIGLGVQRLAINDLQTGDQPISNEDGSVTVICNGEIYNFVELRRELLAAGHRFRSRSDVEVIVHLYEDHGVDCLRRLRGMFAFALWDEPRRRLMLARDRLGIKPMQYAIGPDGCYFGSESKSILIADRIARSLDPRALDDVFATGFVMAERTLFAEIRRLLPGHYLLYRDGEASIHKYWDFPSAAVGSGDDSRSVEAWAEGLLAKLEESVRLHLRGDVPVGAWLSAGVDSSAIAALMSREAREPVPTFSLGFENPDFDEVTRQRTLDRFPGYALSDSRVVCRSADFALFPKALWHLEEPHLSTTHIPSLRLSEAASRHVKVVLTGEGSDELFGGYALFRADRWLRPLATLPLPLRRLIGAAPVVSRRWPGAARILAAPCQMNLARYRAMVAPFEARFQKQLFSSDVKQMLARADDDGRELDRPPGFENWDPFAQVQYYEVKAALTDYRIHKLDRMSMAHSLEARVPFLDHELVEFCAGIPPRLKETGRREKYILRQALRRVLPPEIVWRKKRGLVAPGAQWFRSTLPDFATELLCRRSLADKGYFNPDFVVRLLEQHRAGVGNYHGYLLGILGVQVWDDLFVQGCRP